MNAYVNVMRAMTDARLIGAALGDMNNWRNWNTIWKAALGLGQTLLPHEHAFFRSVAGQRAVPVAPVRRLHIVSGRRSGKSRQVAALGVSLALYADRSKLAPGETGYVMILAPTKEQATTIFDYALAFLQASPLLKEEIESVTANEIKLKGNTAIIVQAADPRTVRGKSLLAALVDESCFLRDTNDTELYRAITPATLTTQGLWIAISSAGRKSGLMFDRWRDHFGKDSATDLVIQARTTDLNLTIDKGEIDAAIADDPEAGRSEYDSAWRSDLSTLFADEVVENAIVHSRPEFLPYDPTVPRYSAFVDMSGGRHDASVLCIGHGAGNKFIADAVYWRPAPHDPQAVAAEFVSLCQEYKVREITGDNFAGSWVSGTFTKLGMTYNRAMLNRSQLYLEALPVFMQGRVEMAEGKTAPTVRELKNLERRLASSGRESVDHPRNGTDDAANALAGCLWLVTKPQRSQLMLAAPQLIPLVDYHNPATDW
ncbi:terminase [Rhizobium sophoriradicis]|uniref:terminase large subunit domain-containing protein n=1 Tax=Rhizobium sophoriradicis TaxID=1535245 RepID=UPI00161E0B18|nr:terminase [Rhizobium leguminosarum bv. phaseoli]